MSFIIAVDGADASCKTTGAALITQRLRDEGIEVEQVQQPGSTRYGCALHELVNDKKIQIAPFAERLLFASDFVNTLELVIKPALAAKKVVVMNRFTYVTDYIYGTAAGVKLEDILYVHRILPPLVADMLVIFRADIEMVQDLLAKRESRIESDTARMEKVFKPYNELERWDATKQYNWRSSELSPLNVTAAIRCNVARIRPVGPGRPHESVDSIYPEIIELVKTAR